MQLTRWKGRYDVLGNNNMSHTIILTCLLKLRNKRPMNKYCIYYIFIYIVHTIIINNYTRYEIRHFIFIKKQLGIEMFIFSSYWYLN